MGAFGVGGSWVTGCAAKVPGTRTEVRGHAHTTRFHMRRSQAWGFLLGFGKWLILLLFLTLGVVVGA